MATHMSRATTGLRAPTPHVSVRAGAVAAVKMIIASFRHPLTEKEIVLYEDESVEVREVPRAASQHAR